MLSEPWLLTRTSKSPLGLATTSIALGKAGVASVCQEFRRHAQAVALRAQEIDDAVGEGHHDLPARRGPARPPPAGRRRPRWRRRSGFVEVEPHQVSPGRHRVAQTAVAHEGGRLDHGAAQVEQRLRLLVIEEAAADARAARSRCRCRR